jgi:quinol monooxygenase YgiN
MERSFRRLLGSVVAAAVSLGIVSPVPAQEAGTAYVVTYIEVVPSAVDQARGLLRQLREASRKAAGNQRFETLQRSERTNHFAIIEAWGDQKARDAHAQAAPTKQFREALQGLLSAGYDERPHIALSVGPMAAPAAGKDAIYVVTHVDIVPTFKDKGVAAVKDLAETSRREAGSARYEALTQSSRHNHMTLVEIWKDQKAFEAHIVAAHMKKFRDELLPMSGSLYDERLYRSLD